MPKRINRTAAATAAATEEPTGQTETGLEESVQEAAAELEQVGQQLPEGARGSLQRFIEGGEKEWCEDLAASEFSPARVRAKWGPGRYVVYWRSPDPKRRGKTIGAGSTRFVLAAGLEDPAKPGSPAAGADAVAGMVLAHTKQMLDGQQMLQQMQMAVLKNLTEPRRDGELTEKLLLAVIAKGSPDLELIKALLSRQQAGPTLNDLVTLADRLANRTNPTSAMKDALGLLEQARELAGEGGDSAPGWVTLAAKALDTIGRAMSGQQQPAVELAPGPQPVEGAQPAAPAPAPAPNPEVPAVPANAHAVFHFLAPHIPALLRHATRDHDPGTYAGVIFDQLEPPYYTEVRDYISRPDFLDLLEANFPQLRGAIVEGSSPPLPVREWFRELRDDLVSRIREELEPPAGEEVH